MRHLAANPYELVKIKHIRRLVRSCLLLERALTSLNTLQEFLTAFCSLREALVAAYRIAHDMVETTPIFVLSYGFRWLSDEDRVVLRDRTPEFLRAPLRDAPGVLVRLPLDPASGRIALDTVPSIVRASFLVADPSRRGVTNDGYPIPHQVPGCLFDAQERQMPLAQLDREDLPPSFIDDTHLFLSDPAHDYLRLAPLARHWLDALRDCVPVAITLQPCLDLRRPDRPGGLVMLVCTTPVPASSRANWSRDFALSVDRDLSRIGWHFVPFFDRWRAHVGGVEI